MARLAEHTPPVPVQTRIEPPSAASPVRRFRALAISIGMAVATMLVSSVVAQISPYLVFVVLLGAGFLSASAYRRSTTKPLSSAMGALLGCLTGLWIFVAFAFAMFSSSGAQLLEQVKHMPQFAGLPLQDPQSFLIGMCISGFFLLTFLPGLGGMIAASFGPKGRHSS